MNPALAELVEVIPAPCDGCISRMNCSVDDVACHQLVSYLQGTPIARYQPRIANRHFFIRAFPKQ